MLEKFEQNQKPRKMKPSVSPYERPQPHYFGAGPALLPTQVLQQASRDLINYNGIGVGLGELSHRSKEATEIIEKSKASLKELLNIPDTHEVFYAQGGGTGGFSAIVYNMLAHYAAKHHKMAPNVDYIVTGSWSAKAAEEAERLGAHVNYVVHAKKSSPDNKYGSIPPESEWNFSNPEDTAYVYYCDNETVSGVEFPSIPKVPKGVELVADMSSNFLSRPIDVSKFGVIFGGAQKNIGIAGISLYIIKKELLERPDDSVLRQLGVPLSPICFDFPTIVKNNSVYNTLSIFALAVVLYNVDLLLAKGGLEAQQKESDAKATKLYETLEKNSDVYKTLVDKNCRSRMNIVFRIPGEGNEERFIKEAAIWGLTGLKGHRSVGGIRISNYNAVDPTSVSLLADFLTDFAKEVRGK